MDAKGIGFKVVPIRVNWCPFAIKVAPVALRDQGSDHLLPHAQTSLHLSVRGFSRIFAAQYWVVV